MRRKLERKKLELSSHSFPLIGAHTSASTHKFSPTPKIAEVGAGAVYPTKWCRRAVCDLKIEAIRASHVPHAAITIHCLMHPLARDGDERIRKKLQPKKGSLRCERV